MPRPCVPRLLHPPTTMTGDASQWPVSPAIAPPQAENDDLQVHGQPYMYTPLLQPMACPGAAWESCDRGVGYEARCACRRYGCRLIVWFVESSKFWKREGGFVVVVVGHR